MSITPTNQIIMLFHNFNFNFDKKKSTSRNLTKIIKLYNIFKNQNHKKKPKEPIGYF